MHIIFFFRGYLKEGVHMEDLGGRHRWDNKIKWIGMGSSGRLFGKGNEPSGSLGTGN
jgi:hypothetical protein